MHPDHRTAHRKRCCGLLVPLMLGLVALLAGGVTTSPAAAVTRDVEVRDAGTSDGVLTASPAVSLLRDADARTPWAVHLANGGTERVTLDLAVTHLAATDGGVEPGAQPVAWAVLPRTTIVLGAGQRGELTVLLEPAASDLPAAIAVTATPRGDPALTAATIAVVWPPGHQPQVELEIVPGAVQIASDEPVVIDLGVRATALPRPATEQQVGPLVVVGGTKRSIAFEAPSSPFGASIEAVAAVDGAEVARTRAGQAVNLAALGLAVVALFLVVGVAVALLRARKT